jgi:hypothetical protein
MSSEEPRLLPIPSLIASRRCRLHHWGGDGCPEPYGLLSLPCSLARAAPESAVMPADERLEDLWR